MNIEQVTFDSALGRHLAALRMAVFVDEQRVPADMEVDEYDPVAVHLAGIEDGAVVATLRLVSQQVDGEKILKIGRVAVAKSRRNSGLGRQLMLAAIEHARTHGYRACVLTSQVQVIGFYEKLGFVAHGPVFDDCGIDHRAMRLDPP
jgi:predicted GNAT family N-acyltransferase